MRPFSGSQTIAVTGFFTRTTAYGLRSQSRLQLLPKSPLRTAASMSGPPKHEMVYLKGLLKDVRATGNFRAVLHTGLYSQLVSMEIPVGGDIGDEVHMVDQILLFTAGQARATINGKDQDVRASDVVVVPAGTQHQFVNTGDVPLELVTVYSPAEHHNTTVHKTKQEGDAEEEKGNDEAPEWARKSKAENEKAGRVKEEGGPYNE